MSQNLSTSLPQLPSNPVPYHTVRCLLGGGGGVFHSPQCHSLGRGEVQIDLAYYCTECQVALLSLSPERVQTDTHGICVTKHGNGKTRGRNLGKAQSVSCSPSVCLTGHVNRPSSTTPTPTPTHNTQYSEIYLEGKMT